MIAQTGVAATSIYDTAVLLHDHLFVRKDDVLPLLLRVSVHKSRREKPYFCDLILHRSVQKLLPSID